MRGDDDPAGARHLDDVIEVLGEAYPSPDELARLLRELRFDPADLEPVRWTTRRRCTRRNRRRIDGR